jgi:alkylation response protein AidB-like acyl-CoA dehydrogenase/GNAT superfamily N-acetyltransferase
MRLIADQFELYERFSRLAEREVAPNVRRHDDEHRFDRAAWRKLAEADFFRLDVSRELGGRGLGLHACAAALQGVADGSSDLAFSVSAVAHLVFLRVLEKFGSPEQHRAYLPRLLSGEWLGAVANAEPQAGTNLLALASRARRGGDGFELTSDKQCITNVGEADLVMCSARLSDAPPRKEVNIFLVEKTAPGVSTRLRTNLSGLRSSCTGDLEASQAQLPAHALLGEVGLGLKIFAEMFLQERLFTGVLYLSALRFCIQRAVSHAETRLQFGRLIGRNQFVQEKVIRMRVAEELQGCLLRWLCGAVERGEDVNEQLSMLKVHGIEAALEASADLVRLLGGRGVGRFELAEKYHRDLLALSILGGTVELHKIVIYGEVSKRVVAELSAGPAAAAGDLVLTRTDAAELGEHLERSLVELTGRLFPDEPSLRGRFYYDTRPEYVFTAFKGGKLVGFEVVPRRLAALGAGLLRVAGIGIGVAPEFQKQGVGTALTIQALELLRDLGDDLAIAFLWGPADRLLKKFGFRPLQAKVTYWKRDTGELVVEQSPAYALDLAGGTLVEELNARGSLHLGVGTW